MKVAEILRALADVVELAQDDAPVETEQSLEVVAQDNEMEELARLSGITRVSTTPCEEVFPVQSVIPAGNDIHYSKNPADMRTDSISLYPGYGAHD